MANEDTETGEVLDALDDLRAKAVAIARAEIGSQTKGSARVKEYVERTMPQYTAAQVAYAARQVEWCGIFALWCLHEAGITDVPWEIGRGFVYRLPQTKTPAPADIFVTNGGLWHHGLVERHMLVDGKPWLESVEGNTPDVRRRSRPAPKNLLYYSIEPWLRAKLDLPCPNPKTP